MKIPFSPPHIDDKIISEVVEALKSGWITTGPRTKLFEQKLAEYCKCKKVVCVNSATAGIEMALRWFGVGQGDEVVIPAYTYTATAAAVIHCGAKPVMVDIDDDLLIDTAKLCSAITEKTKVIIPVDIAGLPCDYDKIRSIVDDETIRKKFVPSNEKQEQLGRIMVLSDAAHSLGATYKGIATGAVADITIFSFHAVKNLTTAEGGAICINLPSDFDADIIYKELCINSLHGQSKDALAKTKAGAWRYDIYNIGYKCNMTDIAAAMGLVELERYDSHILTRRKAIFDRYSEAFRENVLFRLPTYETETKKSSYHVYALRINGYDENKRDELIRKMAENEIATNVHFIPLPLLTAYKSLGYKIEEFPNAYKQYSCEISLPVYYDLTYNQVDLIAKTLKSFV